MSSKTFKPLETIRKHRLDKATLEVTKARALLAQAESNLAQAQQLVEACEEELQRCFARLAYVGNTEIIEVVRARYAIDDARDGIAQAKDQETTCREELDERMRELQEARQIMAQRQRSLDAMDVIIGRMREEEAEAEFAKEEEAAEDLTSSRAKR
jgi:predicted NBD/HSP70 family sugar kinase